MKSMTEIKKEMPKSDETKTKIDWIDLFTKTISSIISGIVIAIVGLYIWKQQNLTTQQQKLYDTKVEILKKMTSDGGKMIHFSEFMIRTKLELYQRFENEYNSSFRPNQDKHIYEKTMKFQLEIQKEKPILYSEYMKGLEFQSDFLATTLITKTVFQSFPELDSLQKLFSEEAIVRELEHSNNGTLPKISLTNKEEIINSLQKKQTKLFSEILAKMFQDIRTIGKQ